MNCPNCKQPIVVGIKFCTNCGCPADAPDFFDANAFGTGFLDVLTKKYFCFRGRARWKEYWTFILFTWIISFVLRILIPFTFASAFGNFVFFVCLCGFGIPEAALTVRRVQDTGKTYWLVLWLWGGFRIMFSIMITYGQFPLEEIWHMTTLPRILIIIIIISTFIIASFDSQSGPNEYGPNPKGI